MRIQSKILVAGGLMLLASPAWAAGLVVPSSFCPSAKNIQNKSKGCEDNGGFTQAAKGCLGNIDATAKKIGLDIKALERTGAQSQRGDMKKAAEEYFQLTRKLDYMIGLTDVATIDVYNYAEHLYRPEDEAEKEEDDMQVPCFGDNVDALENLAKQMEQKRKQFEKVLDLTVSQLTQTQANIDKTETMGSIDPVKVPDAKPATKAPAGPKGKNWGPSDISGTEKKDPKK